MNLSKLASTDSGVREGFLDQAFNALDVGKFSNEEIELELVPGLLELGSTDIFKKESESVFGRSFSTVLLAAVVESDSIRPNMSTTCLKKIYDFTLFYLNSEKDFRGYIGQEKGWAHSVAHVSDLISEMLNHQGFQKEQKRQLLLAFANFIINDEMDILIHDEEQRIARVLYRGLVLERLKCYDLQEFLKILIGEDQDWLREFFTSSSKLNRLSNVKNVCRSLLVMLTTSQSSSSEIAKSLNETIEFLRKIDMGYLDAVS